MDDNRIPPHDEETEQALIGAAIRNSDYFQRDVPDDAFYVGKHREIWQAMREMLEAGHAIDDVSLCAELRSRKSNVQAAYVSQICRHCMTAAHAEHYASQLMDYYSRRLLIVAARQAERRAFDTDHPVQETVSRLMADVHAGFVRKPEPTRIKSALHSLMADLERKQAGGDDGGISTGFSDLDRYARMYPGDLIVIAGRPGMGKTGFALDVLLSAAKSGKSVFLASLEMPKRAIAARLSAKLSGIETTRFRTADFRDSHWPKLAHAMGRLSELPFWIDDAAGVSTAHIRAQAERIRQKEGLDLVAVDYLGLVREPGKWDGREVQLFGVITKNLKQMAKELSIPVLLLAQLNRSVESRKPPRPQLSDLRQSGEIEQDADAVWMLYRPEYYSKEATKPEEVGLGYLQIEKAREGETGDVKLAWIGHTTSYQTLCRR